MKHALAAFEKCVYLLLKNKIGCILGRASTKPKVPILIRDDPIAHTMPTCSGFVQVLGFKTIRPALRLPQVNRRDIWATHPQAFGRKSRAQLRYGLAEKKGLKVVLFRALFYRHTGIGQRHRLDLRATVNMGE